MRPFFFLSRKKSCFFVLKVLFFFLSLSSFAFRYCEQSQNSSVSKTVLVSHTLILVCSYVDDVLKKLVIASNHFFFNEVFFHVFFFLSHVTYARGRGFMRSAKESLMETKFSMNREYRCPEEQGYVSASSHASSENASHFSIPDSSVFITAEQL